MAVNGTVCGTGGSVGIFPGTNDAIFSVLTSIRHANRAGSGSLAAVIRSIKRARDRA